MPNMALLDQSQSFVEYFSGCDSDEEQKKEEPRQAELRRLEKWHMELDNYQEGDLQHDDIFDPILRRENMNLPIMNDNL